jgi:hypothetical protein
VDAPAPDAADHAVITQTALQVSAGVSHLGGPDAMPTPDSSPYLTDLLTAIRNNNIPLNDAILGIIPAESPSA